VNGAPTVLSPRKKLCSRGKGEMWGHPGLFTPFTAPLLGHGTHETQRRSKRGSPKSRGAVNGVNKPGGHTQTLAHPLHSQARHRRCRGRLKREKRDFGKPWACQRRPYRHLQCTDYHNIGPVNTFCNLSLTSIIPILDTTPVY
jgi:hypothetical protein